MKKFILSLFLSIIGFIGFTSAENLSFNGSSQGYTPNNLIIEENVNLLSSINNYTCNSSFCSFRVFNDVDYEIVIRFEDNSIYCINYLGNCENIPIGVYNIDDYGDPYFDNIIFNFPRLSSSSGGGNGGNIVPDGSLTPVITGVFSVFGELIPYVVYIGIGILIVTVGFYAIRRLVNWLSDKINNNFKF